MTRLRLPLIGLAVVSCLSAVSAQDEKSGFRFETLEATEDQARRAAAVAQAVGFADWPATNDLYPLPPVGRALFPAPDSLSAGVHSRTSISISGEPWPHGSWSWNRLGEGREPVRDDWIDLHITVTPGARAAQEQVLASLIDNQLPVELVVERSRAARRPAGLGHVALAVGSVEAGEISSWFVRGNVAVRIRGRGTLAGEVLLLATSLDERLAAQAPLSPDELRARRELPERR